jgi:guanine deaminase
MQNKFLLESIRLAKEGMENNCGGPFGAVIVKDGQIIGSGYNRVLCDNDPTAHAEMVAIRNACQHENNFWLKGAEIYSICEPCPMCLSAIYWAHIDKIYFANTRTEASQIGFDDEFLYQELTHDLTHRRIPTEHIALPEANEIFRYWSSKQDKTPY